MGTALTGLEIKDTYDGLIKTTDNGPLSGTLKRITDGLGNDSALSLSTAAARVTGNFTVKTTTERANITTDADLVTENGIGVVATSATFGQGYQLIRFMNSAGAYSGSVSHTASTGIGLYSGSDLILASNSTERMRIDSTGNVGIGTSAPDTLVTLGTTARTDNTAGIKIFRGGGSASYATYGFAGNAVINSVGGDLVIQRESTERARFTTAGLCFNGDFAVANALDDYEEGFWTMGVTFGGASVGVTTSSNTGTYTKIGRQVTVNGYIILTSKGSSTGTAAITGLPFTVQNATANYSPPSLLFSSITFANQFQGFGVVNSTTIALEEITILGVVTSITDADFANNSQIMVSLTYFV
jgi:hypothetical protein